MKQNYLKGKIATIGLAGLLGGCSSTSANHGASVLGTIIGVAGAQLSSMEKKEVVAEENFGSFFEIGPIYRTALIERVSDVPESIRNVPIHPNDPWGRPGPIPDDEVMIGSRTGAFVRYGPKLNLFKDNLSIKVGLELEFSGSYSTDFPERSISGVGSERGYGASLTFYSIHTKAGPDWNSIFIPKLFAGIDSKISNSFSVGLGCSIWREDLVAETGYDRYDKYDRLAGFNLVDMTVGSVMVSLRYKMDESNYLFLEVGTQDILDKKFYDLGRQADVDFEENPFTISIGGSLTF